jgi:hypothetical protein
VAKQSGPLRAVLLAALAVILLSAADSPASGKPATIKERYHVAQVDLFSAPEDLEFPAKYLQALQDEIIKQLKDSKQFTEVLRGGESPVEKDAAILQVTGTVTRFQPGSRAERYLVGFGAGSTQVFGHLHFLDRGSAAELSSADIRGRVQVGLFGGSSMDVANDFAHRVGETAKMLLAKNVPDNPAVLPVAAPAPAAALQPAASTESASAAPSADAKVPEAPKPSEHHIEFSSGDFEATQKKLAAEGAAGYRITHFMVTGAKTADVVLEKSADPALTYEYSVLHGRTQGGLESRLNKQAQDGFRLVPDNLALFGGVFACIMAKPSAPPEHIYAYKLHASVRVSSAQRNIEKDQAQGYNLAGSATAPYAHLVLLEKEMPAASPKTN